MIVFGSLGDLGLARAIAPPVVDDGTLGPALALASHAGPPDATEQRSVCAVAGQSTPTLDAPVAQKILNLPDAWRFSHGEGQKVAVIDTGVNRHIRLPNLQPGGDFVSDSDGTVDCDAHGTLVAGLIAAQPGADDGFSGVAPASTILAIRQLSSAYQKKGSGANEPGSIADTGYGTVLSLAAAVVRAVDLGATVINLSEDSCSPPGGDRPDGVLGAAVKYAFDRNVVVVAAAGNLEQGTGCDTQNTSAGWNAVQTIVTPAWFGPYVLSVASVDNDGQPSGFSMHGPWVGVAAPGTKLISLDNKPGGTGLVDSVLGSSGPLPLDGTSFSSAYVSGVAALVRARFPELNAGQVIERIERTALNPASGRDDLVGYGLVDPVAALTAQLPTTPVAAGADVPRMHPPLPTPPYVDPLPRRIAEIGSLVLLGVFAVGYLTSIPYRRDRRRALGTVDQFDLDAPAAIGGRRDSQTLEGQ
ncbi:type VII secretion-associated serine protease mycosin [Nocardia sp. CDC160]|uniref:type VII secretion-associated serine protease mycosin n=1 Tax=Nocardia sp. CDC160 TaxID=3112166 RepID=UPI002DC029DD|nr:type VII secretion-associated serine protease mycosin [Nocardia sp. CDC160]MEC3919260.1 type VII secretion-associated serine protease mycosin [Nocardia sp. CDC160]